MTAVSSETIATEHPSAVLTGTRAFALFFLTFLLLGCEHATEPSGGNYRIFYGDVDDGTARLGYGNGNASKTLDDGYRLASPVMLSRNGKVFVFTKVIQTGGVLAVTLKVATVSTDNLEVTTRVDGSAADISPEGKKIIFGSSNPFLAQARYSILDLEDGSSAPLRDSSISSLPRWSPDGTTIAYIASHDSSKSIVLVDARGAHPRIIVTYSARGSGTQCEWLNDSRRLVYVADQKMYVVGIDGSSSQVFIGDFSQLGAFSTSWMDNAIVISGRRGTEKAHLFLVNADDASVRQITGGDASDLLPVLSTDGYFVLYLRWITSTSSTQGGIEFWMVRRDGAGNHRLPYRAYVYAPPVPY